jgi:hypothetical protein
MPLDFAKSIARYEDLQYRIGHGHLDSGLNADRVMPGDAVDWQLIRIGASRSGFAAAGKQVT